MQNKKNIGCYFGLISAMISLLSVFVSIFLFIQINPSFSFTNNFISDLGNGKNNSDIVFNLGRIITGIIAIFCYFLLYQFFFKKEVKLSLSILSLIAGIVASIGSILVGAYPSSPEPQMHKIAGLIAFFGLFLVCIFFGISELTIKNFNKIYAISSFIIAPFSIIYMILYITLYMPGINSEIPKLIEWIAFLSAMFWTIFQLLYILKKS